MHCGDDVSSPLYISSYHNGPYNSSLASSASSSSASVWSDAASQSSDDSSIHSGGVGSESDISDTYCCTSQPPSYQPITQSTCDSSITTTTCWPKSVLTTVAPEQRQNPRRTSIGAVARLGCPPSLVRQCDRKVNFVDSLVDSSAQIVEAIWPLSSVICRSEIGNKGVLPLRTFIQETLRRSRTSYSTLQVALYYLILIKPHVPKHDFTMEQPEDIHSVRALQCGRRMFLAALILASKYLQDRNYSARAWSKISGLNTQEINQNEIAFLLAVNWKLHITDDVFQRWTDIVLKYTPSQPPSPGAVPSRPSADLSASWKSIILQLNPELDNVEGISSPASAKAAIRSISSTSAKPVFERTCGFESDSNESTPTPRYYAPHVLEPCPSTTYPPTKPAPALGLLPTPRLTPQSVGFGTPAVSAASYMLSKSSMGYAMAQASTISASQSTERWQGQTTLSPQGFNFHRRSSLATSVSSMSSPESMVSDNSTRSSRSSSISSASSLMSAPLSSKLDVQARCRYAKLCCDRTNNRTIIATVPEGCPDSGPTSSPDSYTGAVGKDFLELSLETRLAQQVSEDYFSRDSSANDAARALQELHNNPRSDDYLQGSRTGAKRSRPQSIDHTLQDNVRDMLTGQYRSTMSESWPEALVRPRTGSRSITYDLTQISVRSVSRGADGRKRVCCSTEASEGFPEPGLIARPGMWEGILN